MRSTTEWHFQNYSLFIRCTRYLYNEFIYAKMFPQHAITDSNCFIFYRFDIIPIYESNNTSSPISNDGKLCFHVCLSNFRIKFINFSFFLTQKTDKDSSRGGSLIFRIKKQKNVRCLELESLFVDRKVHSSCIQRYWGKILIPSNNLSCLPNNCRGMLVAVLPSDKLKDNSSKVLEKAAKKKWLLGIVLRHSFESTVIVGCVWSPGMKQLIINKSSLPTRYTNGKISMQYLEFPSIDCNGFLHVSRNGPAPIVPPGARMIRKMLRREFGRGKFFLFIPIILPI